MLPENERCRRIAPRPAGAPIRFCHIPEREPILYLRTGTKSFPCGVEAWR